MLHLSQTVFRSTRRARRGIALLMVLGVVAVASVLSWAMLSSSALNAQLDENVSDAVESQYLAESGISYAMHYLQHPAQSPVALTTSAFNAHYPGQTGLSFWSDASGSVDIEVLNTALDTFLVRSTAITAGTCETVEAEVMLATTGFEVATAVSFNGPIVLPTNVTVTGPVSAAGAITDPSNLVLATLGGSTVSTDAGAAPTLAEIRAIAETGIVAITGGTDRTYTMDGVTYVAEAAPATIVGTLATARPTLNPANVWYADGPVILNGATLNGTLVLRNAAQALELQGVNTITSASTKMPALVVAGNLRQKHTMVKAAKLTTNGVAWLGGKITTTGASLAAGFLNFQGSLLMGSSTPVIEGLTGPITISHNAAAIADVQLTAPTTITGLSVSRWSHMDQ